MKICDRMNWVEWYSDGCYCKYFKIYAKRDNTSYFVKYLFILHLCNSYYWMLFFGNSIVMTTLYFSLIKFEEYTRRMCSEDWEMRAEARIWNSSASFKLSNTNDRRSLWFLLGIYCEGEWEWFFLGMSICIELYDPMYLNFINVHWL